MVHIKMLSSILLVLPILYAAVDAGKESDVLKEIFYEEPIKKPVHVAQHSREQQNSLLYALQEAIRNDLPDIPSSNDNLGAFCRGKEPTTYADPTRCDKYVVCSGNRALSMSCSPGTWYSPEKQNCDWPSNVKCKNRHQSKAPTTLSPVEMEKPKGRIQSNFCFGKRSGNYRDPDSCDTFISCNGNIAYRMDCPAKLWYNIEKDQCDYPENVNCKTQPTRPTAAPSTGSCEVNPESRSECGYPGISKETCESRGCCFNSKWNGVTWCYKKDTSNDQCMVNPENRQECGWAGITKQQCESRPGCCFNDKIPGTTWCYKGKNIARNKNEVTKVGCFNQHTIKGMKMSIDDRKHIKWDKDGYTRFVKGLINRCKNSAKSKGFEMFAIVYYGECWLIPNAAVMKLAKQQKNCKKGDGTFLPCDATTSGSCIGVESTAFVYSIKVHKETTAPSTSKPKTATPTKAVRPTSGNLNEFCRGKKSRNYHNPTSCNGFISCFKNEALKMTCPNTLWYSFRRDECVSPLESDCHVRSDYNDGGNDISRDMNLFCVGKISRNYPNPTRCEAFITCVGFMAYHRDCPANLWYNFLNDQCDYPENVDCEGQFKPKTSTPTTQILPLTTHPNTPAPKGSLDNFCIGKKAGNYPDPSRCDGYIACNGHVSIKMDCPNKLWYNYKKDECDDPENVDCMAISKVGCFVQHTMVGLKLALNRRSQIKWDRKGYTKFVNGLIDECRAFTKKKGMDRFAIVNYGECWVVTDDDHIERASPSNQCKKGDGTFLSCDTSNGEPCVGVTDSAFIYSLKVITKVGCFQQYTIMGLQLVLNQRLKIKWGNGYAKFSKELIDECSEITKDRGLDTFAIVFYGECWVIPSDESIKMASKSTKCKKGDGSLLPCDADNGETCVGINNTAFVYSIKGYLSKDIVTAKPIPTSGSLDDFCIGRKPGNYPDPTRCDGFISCNGRIAYRMDCPAKLWYNHEMDLCDWPKKGDCAVHRSTASIRTTQEAPIPTKKQVSTRSLDKFCNGKKSRNYPDPKSCSGFISCNDNVARRVDCPQNKWYNPKTDECDEPANVDCKARFIELCSGRQPGDYPIPGTCNKYYSCLKDHGKLQRCPKHKNFDPKQKKCVQPTNYSCADDSFCKEKKDGDYRNKNNCYGFYQCSGGKTVLKNCPVALRFNGTKCVKPHEYICR